MKSHHKRWWHEVAKLPRGLSVTQAAQKLGWSWAVTRRRLQVTSYPIVDGRTLPRPVGERMKRAKLDIRKVNWKMRNADIARQFGCSRERVGQVRKALGR